MVSVEKVQLITGILGADVIMLTLNIPEGSYPYAGNAVAKMNCAKGDGRKYIEANFPGIETEIIDMNAARA